MKRKTDCIRGVGEITPLPYEWSELFRDGKNWSEDINGYMAAVRSREIPLILKRKMF